MTKINCNRRCYLNKKGICNSKEITFKFDMFSSWDCSTCADAERIMKDSLKKYETKAKQDAEDELDKFRKKPRKRT